MPSRVAKTPGVDGRIFLPKINSICLGRPRSKLSATGASKNARPARAHRTPWWGHLNLPYRQRPAIPVGTVLGGQRQRQPAHPAIEEALNIAQAEPITYLLQHVRVLTEANP
jgi:hypothetical protein